MAAGEGITLASGQDTHWAVGGASRIHTGQAIGLLAGAIKPGSEAAGKGMTIIAGKGDIEVQAQADHMQIAAKNDVSIQSQSAHVDWAAAKKISLSTAGGANITVEGGNITVQCPGKITIKAATKSFVSASNEHWQMPVLPRSSMLFDEKFQLLDPAGDAVANTRYEMVKPNGARFEGVTDSNGMIPLQQGFSPDQLKIRVLGRIKKGAT